MAQKVSCQSDKWLWSYELKQQLFCSWDSSGSQKKNLKIKNFGWIFFHRFLTKFLNISLT
jgi:hypothetical protein